VTVAGIATGSPADEEGEGEGEGEAEAETLGSAEAEAEGDCAAAVLAAEPLVGAEPDDPLQAVASRSGAIKAAARAVRRMLPA
jgi:hypothetical protein